MDVVSSIDVCWMPYYENGQDGSGVASITLELGKKVLCSNTFAFNELFNLEKYCNQRRFDIGNYKELASKTLMYLNSAEVPKNYSKKYTIKSQAAMYVKETL
jgi:hypothetical protein